MVRTDGFVALRILQVEIERYGPEILRLRCAALRMTPRVGVRLERLYGTVIPFVTAI